MSSLAPLIKELPGEVASRLDSGLEQLDIAISAEQRDQLLALVALLHKWNRAYNLTAVRDINDMVARHVLDSAAIAPYVTGATLLDVGAGPGLPGLVIAILKPDMHVTLVDSNGKKVRFQRQAVMELAIKNATPTQTRVEAFNGQTFDQVVSRAFASLDDFVTLTRTLVAPGGQWLAMKGPGADEELAALPADIALIARHWLQIPYDTAKRQLLILTPEGAL
ncbi:16S rRNA (guanine(527)-N(7))-methyltransferase RsmG [Vreelandella sp. TE19]